MVETTIQYKSIIDWDAQGIPYCSGPNPQALLALNTGRAKLQEVRSCGVPMFSLR